LCYKYQVVEAIKKIGPMILVGADLARNGKIAISLKLPQRFFRN